MNGSPAGMPSAVQHTISKISDARLEQALSKRSSLTRWLEFVGGGEFSQLAPLLRGMKLVELMRIPASGLARLGMVPSTARRLSDELNKLKVILKGGVRMPPWLMPLLDPARAAEQQLMDANPLTLGPPTSALEGLQMRPMPPSSQRRPGSARPSSGRPFSAGSRTQITAMAGLGSRPGTAGPSRAAAPRAAPPASARPHSAAPSRMYGPGMGSAQAPTAARPPRWASSAPRPHSARERSSLRQSRGLGGASDSIKAGGRMSARPHSARPAVGGSRPSSQRTLPRAAAAWPESRGRSASPRDGRPRSAASVSPRGGGGGGVGAGGGLARRSLLTGERVPAGEHLRPRASSASPRSRAARLGVSPALGMPSTAMGRLVAMHGDMMGVVGRGRGGGGGSGGGSGGGGGVGSSALGGMAAGAPFGSRPASARSRSSSPRNRDTFSHPPRGALPLSSTPASERPIGLLGSVLRREAAIAAMKTAVQVPPPAAGRDRAKAVRELSETFHEFREATVESIELLAARPEGSARFYWNGMDLVLKMLTDLQWAPFPQLADPILVKWFSYWSNIWDANHASVDVCDPKAFAVPQLTPADREFAERCRKAERLLLLLAIGASREGAGMGGWAQMDLFERVCTLFNVQTHRLHAAHSEGGANHAQKRRFANMEQLIYGREGVHMNHLKILKERTSTILIRAAQIIQRAFRVHKAISAAKRSITKAARHSETSPSKREASGPHGSTKKMLSGLASGKSSPDRPRSPPQSPTLIASSGRSQSSPPAPTAPPAPPAPPLSPESKLDRAYLREISEALPDMA